jgi:hypothetical protein
MRWMLAAALSLLLAVGAVGPGSATQDIQPDLLVTAGDGTIWLVRNGERHAIAPQMVTPDELARWPEGDTFGGQVPPLAAYRAPETGAPGVATPRPPESSDGQREWRRVARWQGNGDKNTEPFLIQGGQWRIGYTVRDPRSNTPRLCIAVRTLDAAHVDSGCYRQDDTTYVYRRGTFYLDISSADQWTVTVEDYY